MARARALREAAGTITGAAAGETFAEAGPSILEDAAAVMTGDRMHSQAICARLAELRPGMYGHLTELDPARAAAWLGQQLAAFGVRTEQVWADDRNLTGVRREAVLAALEWRGV